METIFLLCAGGFLVWYFSRPKKSDSLKAIRERLKQLACVKCHNCSHALAFHRNDRCSVVLEGDDSPVRTCTCQGFR